MIYRMYDELTLGINRDFVLRFHGTHFTYAETSRTFPGHVPMIEFDTAKQAIAAERPPYQNAPPEHIQDILEHLQAHVSTAISPIFSRDDVEQANAFILRHAPWITAYDHIIDDDELAESMEHIRPEFLHHDEILLYMRLCFLSCPVIFLIKPQFIVSDLYYRDSNIYVPNEILQAKSMKALCHDVFGYYSKAFRPILERLIQHDISFTKLAVLRYAHGMSLKAIEEYVEILHTQDLTTIEHRGLSMRDGIPYIPDWFLALSDQARLRWLDQMVILLDVIGMSTNVEDIDTLGIDFRDVRAAHAALIEASGALDDTTEVFENPILPTAQQTHELDGVQIVNTYSSRGLKELALYLNICIDGEVYMRNLQEGQSVFFSGWQDGVPVFASEFTEQGQLIEISGRNNDPVAPDFVQQAETLIREQYFERAA